MCTNVYVVAAVQDKIDGSQAFTSACISHPMIKNDSSVRHRNVSNDIKNMFHYGEMDDINGDPYLRTLVTVYPDGSAGGSAQAWLYYPDNGYDPNTFEAVEKVLTRNPGDGTTAVQVTHTATGSAVSKQCGVQSKGSTLNVPRYIIKAAGWQAGDGIRVDINGTVVSLYQDSAGKQKVDKEGRLRLHAPTVDILGTRTPTALLVTGSPMKSVPGVAFSPDYIQISDLSALAPVAAPVAAPVVAPVVAPAVAVPVVAVPVITDASKVAPVSAWDR